MTIRIDPILPEQKPVFIQMMELYLYDFSEFSEDDINESGYFGYPHIDDYWKEEGRHPFFIRADGQLAGLVLVRCCCEHHQMADPHNIAEFFVMKKYRRKGVGRAAARKVFNLFSGGWEISCWMKNQPAQKFWSRVVAEHTNGNYHTFTMEDQNVTGFTFVQAAETR